MAAESAASVSDGLCSISGLGQRCITALLVSIQCNRKPLSQLTMSSLLPQHLYYINIPAHRNGRLLEPTTSNQRWPVMVFSHGLGGSRNSYSHIVGSLASYGMIVISMDHRDGSSPSQYIRATDKTPQRTVSYKKISHTPSPEVYQERDKMLRIRLWELSLVHIALQKMDEGQAINNLDSNSIQRWKKDHNEVLSMFAGKLDIHDPGVITWAGHSFGAATTIQFVKSVFWRPNEDDDYEPSLRPQASLIEQITPSTPVVLLDLWCLPLQSPATAWLRDKPMPCYTGSGPGGAAILSIFSEGFFKWRKNLQDTKRALCPPKPEGADTSDWSSPHLFYPVGSAHLSQSDFAILFPILTKVAFKALDPDRTLTLNIRAILQHLRHNGIEVAETELPEAEQPQDSEPIIVESEKSGDWRILESNGNVTGWIAVGAQPDDADDDPAETTANGKDQGPGDAVVENEMLGELRKSPAL